jgi:beta-galactosidase
MEMPGDLPIIVAPSVQMVDEALVRKFDDYASGGGHLVLTCRTALMDRTGQLWEGPTAAPIVPLIGATIEAYDGLPDETWGTVEMDGTRHRWGIWADLLYAEPTTRVLAKYADQFYIGAAAVTRARRGHGTVTYCGVCSEASPGRCARREAREGHQSPGYRPSPASPPAAARARTRSC